jgi:hypothetical protein
MGAAATLGALAAALPDLLDRAPGAPAMSRPSW